jgi:uracil phosphoribosyltransferase
MKLTEKDHVIESLKKYKAENITLLERLSTAEEIKKVNIEWEEVVKSMR